MAGMVVMEALARSELLRGLPPDTLSALANVARRRTYRRGEVVLHQGDEGSRLFILVSGRVKIEVDAASGDRAVIGIRGPGECFGELSLIDGEPRSATIQALEAVEALTLNRQDFMPIVRSNVEAMECLLLTLAKRARDTTDVVADLSFLAADGRLAKKLLELADDHGRTVANGIEIDLPITQEDLAAMVSTTRATVSRLLGEYEARGLIQRHGRRIVVADALRLARRIVP